MRNVQAKLEQIQALLYEVRREVGEQAIAQAMTEREPLDLDGRLAVESYHESVNQARRGPSKEHSRGPGA